MANGSKPFSGWVTNLPDHHKPHDSEPRHQRPRRIELNVQARVLLALIALSVITLTFAALFATQFVTFQYLRHLLLLRIDPEHMQGPLGPVMQQALNQLNGPERALLTRIQFGILQAGALALAVSVLLSYLLSRRITRPIAAMRAAAMDMARGDLSRRVPVSSADELGDLGRALNAMAQSLEEADRLRRHMVADLAHELRTPLTGLRSYVEALKDGVMPVNDDTLGTLLAETLRLQRLVQDLHELALLDANALELRGDSVDLAAAVDRAVSLRSSEFMAKGLHLETNVPAGLLVRADPDRLAQILQNLLANAITHTPPGGVINITASHEPDDMIRIKVSNTGEGIPPADLPHIFERFYRADASRSRATGGSGLGLTITRKLVEAHGGSITAESRPGEGAVFTFTLPAAGT